MPPQEEVVEVADDPTAEANGTGGFSEEDMDTEIEVDETGKEKPRRKKKKNDDDKTGETPEEKKAKMMTKQETQKTANDAPTHSDSDEVVEKKKKQKITMKMKMKALVDEPFYLVAGIIVCVILPFGIYACDVILSVNVIDMQTYKDSIISVSNNFSQIPTPFQLIGEKYYVQQSILHTIQFNAKNAKDGAARTRISRDVSEDEQPNVVEVAVDPTPASPPTATEKTNAPEEPDVTVPPSSSKSPVTSSTIQTSSKTPGTYEIGSGQNVTAAGNETRRTPGRRRFNSGKYRPLRPLTNLRPTPSKRTVLEKVNASLFMQQDDEYCLGLQYFYEVHIKYYNETGRDWFDDMTATVYQKEQTMFFMFTILGFITLLIGLGLRCDIFLSDEWSSFILINLFFYSISMAVTVAIFADESGMGNLRCATCRFTSYCYDIDPWDYTTHWPAYPDNVQWAMVALISFVLKLLDCLSIGIVTLKFIVDVTDPLWVTGLKIFGWIFVFPMLIFTPVLGVIRYVALPRISPDDVISSLVMEVFFYVGVVFWGIFIIALPIFCKFRMCSGSEDEERQAEEELYE